MTNPTTQAPVRPYESIDLAYQQETDSSGKPLELSHVEYVTAQTGELLRITLENNLRQGGGPDATVDLLNRNQAWTRLLSVPERVWWRQFTPSPFESGATAATNRENMARIADGILTRAVKILAAAPR